MSWHLLGIDLGRGENILKVAAAVILPEVILAAGTEILSATAIQSGADFVSAIDAINSTTGLTGTEAAKIVGQAAFTAAATDGNLGDVLQNGLTAATGIQVDNIVTDAFDSALAGDVVRSATIAAIGNKDVGQAVALQLIPAGAGAAVGAITSGSTMDDILFPGAGVSIQDNFGYDWQLDTSDVIVSPGDLGLDVAIAVNESGLITNLDPNALFPDDSGVLFNQVGEVVAYTPESYLLAIDYDQNNDVFLTPDNRPLITRQEAIDAVAAGAAGCSSTGSGLNGPTDFCQTPEASIAAKILSKVGPQAGQTVIPGPPSEDRKAETPPANPNGVKLPEAAAYAAAAELITKSAANIWTIIQQVSNGTYRPGQTNPFGTLRPPVPGVPVRNRDGSVTVNNGNGTQTITYPNGTSKTMSTAAAGAGGFGGISTNTLLLAGAGLAALLLLRRK
jgi:hypothetical protein